MKSSLTPTELKQVILDYIRDNYNRQFIGNLLVEPLNPGYKVSFNLDKSENPLVIFSDLEGDEFIEFIKNEIKTRKLHKTTYYYSTKLYPTQNNFCNEQRRAYRKDRRSYY